MLKRRNSSRRVQNMGQVKINISHKESPFHWGDLYHLILTMSWGRFLGAISLAYLAINLIFAAAYMAIPGAIANARPHSFIDAFSFSVQTMATIGYGALYPNNIYGHILVTVEVLVGLLSVAMATSLLFARFSRPTARFLFSAVAVICPYKEIPTLMFRIANQRDNWIVEANVRVSMLLPTEITPEGHSIRRLCDLNLVRSETPLLALTWMIMHPIDPHSPLYGVDPETLHHWQSQFIVTLTGLDETVSQTIHAHHIYDSHDVVWDQRFVDVVSYDTNGDRHLDYSHFHDVVPIIELDLN